MEKYNIVQFAGMTLDKFNSVTMTDVQRFIKEREEVGVYIDAYSIEETLDDLVACGFMIKSKARDGGFIYHRYIPKRERDFIVKKYGCSNVY